jgi:prephenate dehydrogenase
MKSIGIIGFGTFGRFFAQHLARHAQVLVSDARDLRVEAEAERLRWVDLGTAARQEVVVLAVPVQVLEEVLCEVASSLRPGALVFDVASVKRVPVELMQRYVPKGCEIMATHPLFGPQSGAQGIGGLTVVTWPVRVAEERYGQMVRFLTQNLGLRVAKVSPEEHDREMAYVQALTFFIGRSLGGLELPDTHLKTATYQHLLDLRRIVANDTLELFETIQRFNPYASEVRERFTRELDALERGLET